MTDTFENLYAPALNAVFTEQARQQMAQGTEAWSAAQTYAEQGKPDFTLAFLLLLEQTEEAKRETLAHAYERRAVLSEEKASKFSRQFHRPFPLMKLEARRDLQVAQAVRQGQPIPARN